MSVTEKTSFSLFSSFKIHFENCFVVLGPWFNDFSLRQMYFRSVWSFRKKIVMSTKNSDMTNKVDCVYFLLLV